MTELSQKYEHEFFEDMEALGVEFPSTVVRVSQHMDEVNQHHPFAICLHGSWSHPICCAR